MSWDKPDADICSGLDNSRPRIMPFSSRRDIRSREVAVRRTWKPPQAMRTAVKVVFPFVSLSI